MRARTSAWRAWINKDLTAAMLAVQLHADMLLLLTVVPRSRSSGRQHTPAPLRAVTPLALRSEQFARVCACRAVSESIAREVARREGAVGGFGAAYVLASIAGVVGLGSIWLVIDDQLVCFPGSSRWMWTRSTSASRWALAWSDVVSRSARS